MLTEKDFPAEVLNEILLHLRPSFGPESGLRPDHALCGQTLVSCMKAGSRKLYEVAEPLLYHTVTSGQLKDAMESEGLTPERRDQLTGLVHELYASYEESRTIASLPGLTNAPVTQLQVSMCANLQVLVLSITTYPRFVLPPQLLRYYDTLPLKWSRSPEIPLEKLCKFEIRPIEYLRDDLDLASDGWLLLLARLPQMETISVPTITERALASPQEQETPHEQPLSIKSLALTSQPLTPELLEAVLKTFPLLEELSVTWPDKGRIWPTAADIWPQLGRVLHEHGLSLRKIHFEYKRASRGSLINLAGLSSLQSLALPIDALISEPVSRHQVATTAGGVGQALLAPHGAGAGANTFTIPLIYLLPPNLSSLTIMDHRNLQADAHRLDNQLRDLMVHRTFSGLRSIRLRRRRPFIQSGGWGWLKYSPERFWQVLERR